MINKLPYLHFSLFAIAPALFMWSQNFSEVFFREVFVTLSLMVLFSWIVFGLLQAILRNSHKSAIMTSVVMVFTLSYQYIFGHLAATLGSNTYTLLIVMTFILIIFFIVIRAEESLASLTKILATFSVVFVLITVAQLIINYQSNYGQGDSSVVETIETSNTENLPDIYHIILDEHASPTVLREIMDFEEIDRVVKYLENKGFFITEGISNYSGSANSIPSILNLRYVDEGDTPKIKSELLKDHLIGSFLQSQGYKFLHFGAPWTTYYNKYADENINIITFSEYQRLVFKNTIFSPFNDQFDFLNARQEQWNRINFQLDELAKIPEREGSHFAFVHMFVPHVPYVFDDDGSLLDISKEQNRSEVENYLNQVAYIDKEMEKLVGKLLEDPDYQPIIIIQGDHGMRFLHHREEALAELSLSEEKAKDVSFGILNAIYLPDGGNELLYKEITPVNTFRVILNHYFNQDLELLEDRSFVMKTNNSWEEYEVSLP